MSWDDPLARSLVAAIGVLVLGVAFLSLAEASLVAASHIRLRRLTEEGDRRAAAVIRLTEKPAFLSAIIVAINLLVITISCLATVLVHYRLSAGAHATQEVVHIAVLGVILVFAEITPKNVGAAYATPIAGRVAGPIGALTTVMAPLVAAVTAAGNVFLRGAGVRDLPSTHFITEEELKAAVDVGEEQEVLDAGEGEMFDSALALAVTRAQQIMVPRVDVVALEAEATVDEALKAIQDSGFSRIPVYDDTIDHVIGVLYAKDLLRCLRERASEGRLARELMREAMFVPESKPVDEVFREMREQKRHLAVVVGEQGGTEGIVTIEDILEELVGDIEDEHDIPGEEIRLLSEKEALVVARVRLEEVNKALGLSLPEEEYETLGGYVSGRIGRIPEVGETIGLDELEIKVQGDAEEPLLLVRLVKDEREGGES